LLNSRKIIRNGFLDTFNTAYLELAEEASVSCT